MTQAIVCESLVHVYGAGVTRVIALQGLDLDLEEGELVAVVGRSGSGKTTLLNILAGEDVPTAGAARVDGHDLTRLSGAERDAYRRRTVGYVVQQPMANLDPTLSVAENVDLPLAAIGIDPRTRRRRSLELLDALSIAGLAGARPGELSSGEQQRVAAAAALAPDPRVLLADEPTAHMDSDSAHAFLSALDAYRRANRLTVLLVTHDSQVDKFVDRVIRIRDGRTSTEREPLRTSEELIVLDRAGRLQLPEALVRDLGFGSRVRVRREGDHIVVERVGDDA
jgi:putative ABC transport system ATP-binding protein